VLLLDGACDFDGAEGLSSVEIYDPHLDQWSWGPDLPSPLPYPAVARIPDGRVMLAGGGPSDDRPSRRCGELAANPRTGPVFMPQRTSSVYVFDEETGWSIGPSTNEAHHGATALLVLDGSRLMIIGQGSFERGLPTTAETLDLESGRWYSLTPEPTRGWSYAMTALADGRALVVGGNQCPPFDRTMDTASWYSQCRYLSTMHIFDR
jgi:hypothetical protein